MCIDFRKIDLSRINRELNKEVAKTTDPIFGPKPSLPRKWTSFPSRHGNLINKSLLEFIRAIPGWSGLREFKITDLSGHKFFIDNLVFNRSLNLIIAIECKRDLDRQPAGSISKIMTYKSLCRRNKSKIINQLGLNQSNTEIYFCVFDAYGPRKNNYNFNIIYPENLESIFGKCLDLAWKAFEKTCLEEFQKADFPVDKSYEQKVSDMKNLKELSKEALSEDEEDCEVTREKFDLFFNAL